MPNHKNQHPDDFPYERPVPFDPDTNKGYIPMPPPVNEPQPDAGYVPLPPPIVIPEQIPEPPPSQED